VDFVSFLSFLYGLFVPAREGRQAQQQDDRASLTVPVFFCGRRAWMLPGVRSCRLHSGQKSLGPAPGRAQHQLDAPRIPDIMSPHARRHCGQIAAALRTRRPAPHSDQDLIPRLEVSPEVLGPELRRLPDAHMQRNAFAAAEGRPDRAQP
jgi:hypothetical protein